MFLTKYHNNFLSIVGKNNIRLKNQLKNPQKMNQHKYPLNQGGFWGGGIFSQDSPYLHKLFVGQKFRAHRLISQAVEAQIEADKVW